MAGQSRQAMIAKAEQRREAIWAELNAGPGQPFTLADGTVVQGWKPTYGMDGESPQWETYKAGLYKELDDLERLIQQYSSPFCIRSRGRS